MSRKAKLPSANSAEARISGENSACTPQRGGFATLRRKTSFHRFESGVAAQNARDLVEGGKIGRVGHADAQQAVFLVQRQRLRDGLLGNQTRIDDYPSEFAPGELLFLQCLFEFIGGQEALLDQQVAEADLFGSGHWESGRG